MRLHEYAGFTQAEAQELAKKDPRWLEELSDDGPIPAALIDLAPGHKRPSSEDVLELRRFGEFLRQGIIPGHSGDGSPAGDKG